MESGRVRLPFIANAIVGGQGKEVPFAILELRGGGERPNEEEIWAAVEAVNEQVAALVRTPRDKTIVVDRTRPFVYTGKGTLNRRGVLDAYEKDIEAMYPAG